jgi:hypothetical protein
MAFALEALPMVDSARFELAAILKQARRAARALSRCTGLRAGVRRRGRLPVHLGAVDLHAFRSPRMGAARP